MKPPAPVTRTRALAAGPSFECIVLRPPLGACPPDGRAVPGVRPRTAWRRMPRKWGCVWRTVATGGEAPYTRGTATPDRVPASRRAPDAAFPRGNRTPRRRKRAVDPAAPAGYAPTIPVWDSPIQQTQWLRRTRGCALLRALARSW